MGRTYTYDNGLPFVASEQNLAWNTGRQIDWDSVPDKYRSTAFTVKLNGAVLVDATSITVDALPQKVLAGQLLYFGEAKEFVRVTANAAGGATTVTVEAVPTALEDDDEAIVGGSGDKVIPAGTAMAELTGGKIIPRADSGSDTAIGLLGTTATENDRSQALTGHGVIVGGLIYQNLLPDFANAAWASTWRGELETAGVGAFVWQTYANDAS